jgi:hypothetical protein
VLTFLRHRIYRSLTSTLERIAVCKAIRYSEYTDEQDCRAYKKEVAIMRALGVHTNIITYVSSVEVLPGSESAKNHHPGYYILLEYALLGELFGKLGMSESS